MYRKLAEARPSPPFNWEFIPRYYSAIEKVMNETLSALEDHPSLEIRESGHVFDKKSNTYLEELNFPSERMFETAGFSDRTPLSHAYLPLLAVAGYVHILRHPLKNWRYFSLFKKRTPTNHRN